MRLLFLTAPQQVALLAIIPTIAASPLQTRFKSVLWDDDAWAILHENPDQGHFQSRMSLANGYLGINVAAIGPFFEYEAEVQNHTDHQNGWPLFNIRQTTSTIAGFYNWQETTEGSNYPELSRFGGESVISGVPHWSGLYVEADGAILNASTNLDHITQFRSILDIGAGTMSWSFNWHARPELVIDLQYTMFVHKLHVNKAAVQLRLEASRDVPVTVYDVLDGRGSLRTEFVDKKYELGDTATIWSAVRPANVTNVTAYIYSTLKGGYGVDMSTHIDATAFAQAKDLIGYNDSSIAQCVSLKLEAGMQYKVEKYIGGASSDAFSDPKQAARTASITGAGEGFSSLLESHMEEWSSILTKDSVDRFHCPNGSLPLDYNIKERQITAVTNPFYILQNTVGPNAVVAAGNNPRLGVHSISVCGLGSDCYAGHIMWDADVWIAPGLQVSHPYSMQQVVKFRIDQFPQAQENLKMAFASSQNETNFSVGGAVYPWTTGRYGNCTATGPCFDYEYHLNGDIGVSMYNQLVVTGDEEYFKEKMLPIHNAISHFYGELLTYNESSDYYRLMNATDPDEYANNVDRPSFTTALIFTHFNMTNLLNLRFGLPINETWRHQSDRTRIPYDNATNITLEYAGMLGTIQVKQADVVLIDDILHHHNYRSLASLDYYAAKQSEKGPGMTYAAYSVASSELAPYGCSSGMRLQYTYDLYSSQPYARPPWFQFSEQLIDRFRKDDDTHPAFPFLTGMGGAHRVAIFGYLGLHLHLDSIRISPSLPPQIPYLNYRTFYWQGYGIDAHSNQTHTTLKRLPLSTHMLPNANPIYASEPICVKCHSCHADNYYLTFDSPVVVQNRQPGTNLTVARNILQCRPVVYSVNGYMPGQFPFAAIDGAASTKWQPLFSHKIDYLTVELGDTYYPIRTLYFDWGSAPPAFYEVIFSNYSRPPFEDGEKENATTVHVEHDIQISAPWLNNTKIYPLKGNETNKTLDEVVWTGRFVTLGIWGTQAHETAGGPGATVAEWNLVAEEGWFERIRKVEGYGCGDDVFEGRCGDGGGRNVFEGLGEGRDMWGWEARGEDGNGYWDAGFEWDEEDELW